ncbi:MAG: pantetheine-phosphate adenylyltransferase [Candidatus Dormibacteraeota bacterium]|nr:pantetheine-phosphate adenylyltransferase [Candidatus Dormibacteraeota bacterium]MBO0743736.1 pantetheine-phosphate adenylyltransferase [Candidatus Dormibacteraeota bacterium]
MTPPGRRRALYPGTFDPLTLGHLDVIERAVALFDEVVIAVSDNPGKNPLFTPEERVEMVRASVSECPGLRVVHYAGLTVDCALREGATVLIRGLRTTSDLEIELQQAMMNREMAADLQTVFLPAQASRVYLSSTILKEVARYGRDISAFVPEPVARRLKEKLR